MLPESISRALAIDPTPGSTYLDAEHVVILMQENRSFDHCYGTLRGVRGFNDPRALTLPSGNPVWLQTNRAGETYAPFRLNIKETKATWVGSLPHGWRDQSLARNEGRHDQWLVVKPSSKKDLTGAPMTLGYYDRQDIPFYYAFADAFTVCDQNFCSSLTGTTPNRLHLWTGTIRDKASPDAKACVRNEDADLNTMVNWTTFPERLEEAGVSWCIYQNELTIPTGFTTEEDSWLANYGDNPIEYFKQFHVQFHPRHREYQAELVKTLPDQIAKMEAAPQPWSDAAKKALAKKKALLASAQKGITLWTEENFAKLPPREQSLHRKAFVTNEGDPTFRELETLTYQDGGMERKMKAPKGDVFHQFRRDVETGKLPTVSWIVAPENFSDHPSAPWFGAWYVSETLDILTKNPEVWKKTILILCYDENDGYFDHVTPFVTPHPDKPETGKVSAGIDLAVEHVWPAQEGVGGHVGPIGLGYRVPLVIASPWSRGGYACSQVFDHTSIVQFLEKWTSHKSGKAIREPNIHAWRRVVCGDLTSVFRPWQGQKVALPQPVERVPFLASIDRAQYQPLPKGFKKLEPADVQLAREHPEQCPWLPRQEKGTRPSCALPYELAVDGTLSVDRKSFTIRFSAGKEVFGAKASGAPFHVYGPGKMRVGQSEPAEFGPGTSRFYGVTAGDKLEDSWSVADFEGGAYHLRVHGPNGFFREFRGTMEDPAIEISLEPARAGQSLTGNAVLRLANRGTRPLNFEIEDASYGETKQTVTLSASGQNGDQGQVTLDFSRSQGWHDVRVRIAEAPGFERRYAGRIETGKESISDPAMGRG